METKEFKVNIPDGYEIDEENSTFKCIKFKPIKYSKFSDYDGTYKIKGWDVYIDSTPYKYNGFNNIFNKKVFATEKQAKSALAMAQISQIMANDERFGGVVTDEEWENSKLTKYCIIREFNHISSFEMKWSYTFMAFHTEVQRDLFLQENKQLVKDYLMVE